MDVRLNGPGRQMGLADSFAGVQCAREELKGVKGCMARIVRNYSTFGKRNRFAWHTDLSQRSSDAFPQPCCLKRVRERKMHPLAPLI